MNRAASIATMALAGLMVLGALVIVGAMAWWTLSDRDEPSSAVVALEVPPTVEAARPAFPIRTDNAVQPDPAWVARTAKDAGIPEVAMRAYGRAAILAGRDLPGCKMAWNTLAGIGWNESHHGTIKGRTLNADGTSSRPILGPVLDGSGPFAAIRATEASQQWHGNKRWDRAVGPMQFISESWERWASDADGDGVANPHDLDDAAWTAARYLCASGADLTTGEGWRKAVLSYNRSTEYADAVFRAATAYATRVAS
ncbi:lytic transglycosylase domain-containing protein [Nocardioides sp. Bht2]|uniref:lytic transglycosylase domain-containing protein n=1 Tax=Nocardioides sp. Bht2 TaxID=3392297 RepID=UPI0039B57579